MTPPKPVFAVVIAAVMAASAAAQGADNPAGLLPPQQLFAPRPTVFQQLYNDASECSGAARQLRANAAVFAARALNETTAAQRAGNTVAAEEMNTLFVNAATIRAAAATAADRLDSLRATLAARSDVNDATGLILQGAGARQILPLQLETLPTSGQPLQDGMFHRATSLLADLQTVQTCLETVNAVELPGG